MCKGNQTGPGLPTRTVTPYPGLVTRGRGQQLGAWSQTAGLGWEGRHGNPEENYKRTGAGKIFSSVQYLDQIRFCQWPHIWWRSPETDTSLLGVCVELPQDLTPPLASTLCLQKKGKERSPGTRGGLQGRGVSKGRGRGRRSEYSPSVPSGSKVQVANAASRPADTSRKTSPGSWRRGS